MKGLLRRAGVDVEARLVSNEGHTYVYEPRDGGVHDLALKRNPLHVLFRTTTYTGFTAEETGNVTGFILRNLPAFFGLSDIEPLDDVCFTAWCIDNGLTPSIAQTEAFHISRDAQLNWPGEISAYCCLQQLRFVSRDYRTTEYGFPDGGMSERFWKPILAYVASMGGEYEMMRQLVGLHWQGDRITGAVFSEPDSAGHDQPGHHPGKSRYEGAVPSKPDSEVVDTEFDYLISTLPAPSFARLNPGDERFWSLPGFADIGKLRSVVPLAMQIWHRERLSRRYESVVAGLKGPLRYVVDNKHVIREYRNNPRYGSVLYLVGQETGYEGWQDEALLDLTLDNLSRLPGFERIDRAGILHWRLVRNRGFHKRYLLTEPGTLRFRPHCRTPFSNLFLGGDWVRSETDFPCMETAVRTGIAAADALLESV